MPGIVLPGIYNPTAISICSG